MSYKSNIIKALDRIESLNGTANPDASSNSGSFLGPVFLWETIHNIAQDKMKKAWTNLAENNLIPADDTLRDKVKGDEVIISSPSFALQVKVTQPRESFDQTLFIDKAAKKFSIDKHKLMELAAQCKKSSRAPLSKKVVEIA